MKFLLLPPLAVLTLALAVSQSSREPETSPRRISVLFLGAPTANHPGHDPIERYRTLRQQLGIQGIDFTYTEDPNDLRREVLDQHDALLLYANWEQNGPMKPEWEQALVSYVEDGGGFLPIHCASACFGASDAFIRLVGGRFQSHGDGVFRARITEPNHPIMRGYESFEAWDETYVHDRHGDDRTILQKREDEPWTWVRQQGKGRVFYTAYGHDMRCWGHPGFHELMRRAILWTVGPDARAKWMALKLPKVEMEEMVLPGYLKREKITAGQKPLPPAESMKLAQVPPGFELSLFAHEPNIVNPIHIAWDHRGRAFVIETVDYPNNLQAGNIGNDRITICEDTNGDGKADKFTVFADKLSVPTSMVFANGGVICTNGTELLFLQDTNGDDRADVRRILIDGFSMGDTHAGPSNLRYGPDNWIYATVGYSGFKGEVGGKKHEFSSGLFRFRPDGSEMEFLQSTTNNTWGLGFTSDFDILGSTANANPSWFFTFSQNTYRSAGIDPPRTPRADDNPKFFPISTDIRQVDVFGGYTSAAGHSFYTSNRFPEPWRERVAMITEPTGKLVGLFETTPKGAGWQARQLPNNLYNSADAWSGPVQAETGPDGAVWIADWYNLIIQHNPTPTVASAGVDFQTGKGNAYETPLRDTRHGRIYRIFPKNTPDDPTPNLNPAQPDSLVAALSHPNQLWRLHAQRLLVESRATSASPALGKLLSGQNGHAALHAYHTLAALDALDETAVQASLQSSHRGLRRAAITHPLSNNLLLTTYTKDNTLQTTDDRELAELFIALTRLSPSQTIGALLYTTASARLASLASDPTLSDAWQIAARHHAPGVVLAAAQTHRGESPETATAPNLLPNPDFAAGTAPWTLRRYGGAPDSDPEMTVTDEGRNGGKALRIRATRNTDAGAGVEVTVKPNTRYRLSGWVRTENLRNRGGRGAMLNVHLINVATRAISRTTDWTELSTEFTTGNESRLTIHCLFGGYGGASGTAWWSDVSLTEISTTDARGLATEIAKHLASTASETAKTELAAALHQTGGPLASSWIETLRTTVPTTAAPARKHTPDPQVHERGAAVYTKTCLACHGPDGMGVPAAFPPLVGSSRLTGEPSTAIRIVLHGMMGPIDTPAGPFNSAMAPLGPQLNDAEIADVLTYVRQRWSNDAPPIDAASVAKIRAAHPDRVMPWTQEELENAAK